MSRVSEREVEGLRDLSKALLRLPAELRKRYLKFAVMSASKLIRDLARQLAPKKSGALRRAIIIKFRADKSNDNQATYIVCVRNGVKVYKHKERFKVKGMPAQTIEVRAEEDAFYWRFVEFGTQFQKAQPFMRKAFETLKNAAVDEIASKLRVGIEEIAKKG